MTAAEEDPTVPVPEYDTLTIDVLRSLQDSTSARVKEVNEALVRHLHAFVREVRPTTEEWAAGINFLTRTGHACSAQRQEFVLLSDVLGASMLVDSLDITAPDVTESTVLGPFYREAAPEQALGTDIGGTAAGETLLVEGTVTSSSGAPVVGAVVDTWQSDGEGYYDVQLGARTQLRARFRTDGEGRFSFRSVLPVSYPIPDDGPVGELLAAQGRHPYRPAHVHFLIDAAGHERLVTQIFVAGDPYLGSDVIFGVKDSLVRDVVAQPDGTYRLRCCFVLAVVGQRHQQPGAATAG